MAVAYKTPFQSDNSSTPHLMSQAGDDAPPPRDPSATAAAANSTKQSDGSAPIRKIVPCPSCNTKYLLDDTTLQGLCASDLNTSLAGALRFHCSACDLVFSTPYQELQTFTPSPKSGGFLLREQAFSLIGGQGGSVTSTPTASPRPALSTLLKNSGHNAADQATPSSTPASMNTATPLSTSNSPATRQEPPRRATVLDPFKILDSKKTAPSSGAAARPQPSDPTTLSAWVLLAPLASVCVALLGLVIWFGSDANTVERFVSAFFSSSPKSAPASLMVRVAKFRQLALDNGEVVSLIMGEVHNRSTAVYGNVQVEGTLFNRDGEVVARKIGIAPGKLAGSKLRSLTLSSIMALERTPVSKTSSISPLDKVRFVIPFTPTEAAEAVAFATRIYSAEEQ